MKSIGLKDVEELSFMLAKEHFSFDEPIPDFSTRYPGILESCLATPFVKFGRKFLYRTLTAKASMLFYLMIKNHPFQNGNKRIAMTTLFVFLHKNGKWLAVDEQGLYNFTVWVAASPREAKDGVVIAIEKYLNTYISDNVIKKKQ